MSNFAQYANNYSQTFAIRHALPTATGVFFFRDTITLPVKSKIAINTISFTANAYITSSGLLIPASQPFSISITDSLTTAYRIQNRLNATQSILNIFQLSTASSSNIIVNEIYQTDITHNKIILGILVRFLSNIAVNGTFASHITLIGTYQ
jgi:hypothetical protein